MLDVLQASSKEIYASLKIYIEDLDNFDYIMLVYNLSYL